ncbi:MAG: polysaccharide lyase 6 family protein [Roseimicrobium sp.]
MTPPSHSLLVLSALSLWANAALGKVHQVADVTQFDKAVKQATPGDSIVLQSGEWHDADLHFRGVGTAAEPITLRAAVAGSVRFVGNSRLRLSGAHLVVEGLWFLNALPRESDIVAFRGDSKRLAEHCVLKDCAITQTQESQDQIERKWVSLYGRYNRVEHCHFEGKTSKGTLLVVWLPDAVGAPVAHRIENNYFGPRPRLGKNGGEIIRIGDSAHSMQRAECVVSGNFFERCDGEVECISNKSCGNLYDRNTFLECQGTLTLRHGNGCTVTGNFFYGNTRASTGGIRVIGEDHTVRGNRLVGLRGDGARSAICLVNGLENSPANGYFQVKRALIEANQLWDCHHNITIGYGDEDVTANQAPQACRFEKNQVFSPSRSAFTLLEPRAEISWKGNEFWTKTEGSDQPSQPGITFHAGPSPLPYPPRPVRRDEGLTWNLQNLSS